MTLPSELTPTEVLTVSLPSGTTVDLPVCHPLFAKWTGILPNFDFGKKPLLSMKGKGVFAELLILRLLTDFGWDGVWVETYGGVHFMRDMPTSWKLSRHGVPIPLEKEALLRNIWRTAKTTGCFDVLVWRDTDILFAESKQKGEKLTGAQLKFIEGALVNGVRPDQLLIVDWRYED